MKKVNFNTSVYSSSINGAVKAIGSIRKVTINTSFNQTSFNQVTGTINNDKFVMLDGGTIVINLDPSKTNIIDLTLKGHCIVIVEKESFETELEGNPTLNPLALKVK